MSILSTLNNLNISKDQLENISNIDIIKIEKRLKAEVKFNDTININDVERILNILKENSKELSLLFDNELQPLKYVLQNSVPKMLTISQRVNKYDQNFKDFLTVNFKNEIDLYINNCFKEEHYIALHSLLKLQELLDFQVLENITQRFLKKINYGTEHHNLHNHNYYSKADFFTNPFFFRCLNLLSPYVFEPDLISLLVNINTKYKDQKDSYLLKILFSISEFNFTRDDIKQFITHIKQVAIDNGIVEINYRNSKEINPKGGTKDAYENTSSSFIITVISIIAFVFVMFLIITTLKSTKKEEIPSLIKTRYIYDKHYQSNIDSIDFFQSMNVNIIYEKDIELNMDTIRKYKVTYFKDFDSSFIKKEIDLHFETVLNKSTIFYNTSEHPVLIMTEGFGYNEYETLQINDTLVFNKPIKTFKLYIGDSPQIIKYLTNTNDTLIGFRFKNWNYIDQDNFNTRLIKSNLNVIKITIYDQKTNIKNISFVSAKID